MPSAEPHFHDSQRIYLNIAGEFLWISTPGIRPMGHNHSILGTLKFWVSQIQIRHPSSLLISCRDTQIQYYESETFYFIEGLITVWLLVRNLGLTAISVNSHPAAISK
jgi:hypothetical protein